MILVSGARGVVGRPLVERLNAEKRSFVALSRQPSERDNALTWDLTQSPDQHILDQLKDVTTLIHCAPIWLLPEHLHRLHAIGLKRLIVFSSTSVLSKQLSTDKSEQPLVSQSKYLAHRAIHKTLWICACYGQSKWPSTACSRGRFSGGQSEYY